MGQRPSTHTGVNRAQHIGYNTSDTTSDTIHRCNIGHNTSDTTSDTIHRCNIGRNTSVATHLYKYVLFHQRIPTPDLRPCAVEGRCPYLDILPLQGAILFKPCSWGEPRVSQSFGLLYPGLRYHCPYRAPRVQNHRNIA